ERLLELAERGARPGPAREVARETHQVVALALEVRQFDAHAHALALESGGVHAPLGAEGLGQAAPQLPPLARVEEQPAEAVVLVIFEVDQEIEDFLHDILQTRSYGSKSFLYSSNAKRSVMPAM